MSEKNIKLVYICSPFSGDTENNTKKARKYSRFAVDQGVLPITPHLFFPQFMDDNIPEEREQAILMNGILLEKCSEIWVFGDTISNGMKTELEQACQMGMMIRYFSDDLIEKTF